jgi:hypothetical protein
MKKDKQIKKDEAGKIPFSKIRSYIEDLDFSKHYGHHVEKEDILAVADKNAAPEEIISLLYKLEDTEYKYFHEIQHALDELQKPVEPEKELTEYDKLKQQIDEHKKCLKDKDKRIAEIENRWDAISVITHIIWYGLWITLSYWLISEITCKIASNGVWGIMDYINWFSSRPAVTGIDSPNILTGFPMIFLILVAICLFTMVTIGWLLWFEHILSVDDE